MFQRVVVGADESATAREAVRSAMRFAQACGAELHIVTAYKPGRADRQVASNRVKLGPEMRGVLSAHPADMLLADLQGMVEQEGIGAIVHAAAGEPAEALCEVAEQEGADLIVVGNKGMKGARRVLGSVPNSVAHSAHCSVLIVDTVG